MKVLHVLGELNPSGAETMLRVAAPYFSERGVLCEILSTGTQQIGSYAPKLAAVGYKIHHIPFSKSAGFFRKLHALMKKGRYDVIHLHTERANFWIGLTALMTKPRCTLRTIHNNFEFQGTLRLVRTTQRNLLSLLGLVHVSIGKSVQNNELKRFGLKTIRVPNWYDGSTFTPCTQDERKSAREKLGIADNETVLVSVGNCSPVKNHSVILQAIATLPVSYRPVYLHIGQEEEGYPERQLAVDLGIEERVVFLGPLSDVRSVLGTADLYLMPSLYEGFGIAAVEALGMGLPAIFADVSGLRDFKEEFEGLIYTRPDATSFAATLKGALHGDWPLLQRCGEGNAKTASNLYGIARGVSGYLAIYEGGR